VGLAHSAGEELVELLILLTEEGEEEGPLDATPITVKNIGGRSVLFTEDGKRLTAEKAGTIARRIFGYEGAGTLQEGPIKKAAKE